MKYMALLGPALWALLRNKNEGFLCGTQDGRGAGRTSGFERAVRASIVQRIFEVSTSFGIRLVNGGPGRRSGARGA